MGILENRYRRLLALYPAWHRQRYQAEMLTTLMDGASPRQRAPRLHETIDLAWNALRLRFDRDAVPHGRDPSWMTAAAVFGPLAAIAFSAIMIMRPASELGWLQRTGYSLGGPPTRVIPALAGAFLLVGVLALARWRKVAAAVAWLAALTFGAWHFAHYADNPPHFVDRWPAFVTAVTIAVCLTLPSAPTQRPVRQVIGGRLLLLFGAAAAAVASSKWTDAMLAHVRVHENADGSGYQLLIDNWGGDYLLKPALDTVGAIPLLIYVAFLAVTIRVLAKVGGPVRRRMLVFAAVPVTTYLVVTYFFNGFAASSMRFWPTPVKLAFEHWLVLILLPLLVFAAGVLLVRRKDIREELIADGRAYRANQTAEPL